MTHIDTTAAALLAGILARPDDDTPRLVYADWLDEHEQHERAEFIRVQCELARLLARVEQAGFSNVRHTGGPLHARERELLADADRRREWARVPWGKGGKGDALCPPSNDALPQPDVVPHFRRGFVERVEVPALSWLFERYVAESVYGHSPEYAWRVTPWALAVASTHPVTEWVVPAPESPQELPPDVFRLWIEGRELPFALADVVRAAVLKAWGQEVWT